MGVLRGHEQEVCGLKWSPSGTQLASGGNDNLLHIWSATGAVAAHSGGRQHSLDLPHCVELLSAFPPRAMRTCCTSGVRLLAQGLSLRSERSCSRAKRPAYM